MYKHENNLHFLPTHTFFENFHSMVNKICKLCYWPDVISPAIWKSGNIISSKSGSSSMLLCESWKVKHFIARQISALNAWLGIYREKEVVVSSGWEDFEVHMKDGNSFVVLGFVKEKFSTLFHT